MTAVAHAPLLGARALRTAARGAVLIGAAVVLGIVLLQVVHDAGGGGSSSGAGIAVPGTKSTTSTTARSTTSSTAKPAQQVSVAVLNASGASGAAATRANVLRGLGYRIAATGNGALQNGSTVACKQGLAPVADIIARSIGPTTRIAPFPTPEPAVAVGAECIVTIGK